MSVPVPVSVPTQIYIWVRTILYMFGQTDRQTNGRTDTQRIRRREIERDKGCFIPSLLWIEQENMRKRISKSFSSLSGNYKFVSLHVLFFTETEEYGKLLLYFYCFCANGPFCLFYVLLRCLVCHR